MLKRWLLLGATLLMAVLAVAFVACGDDEDEEEEATPTTAEEIETPPAETPEAAAPGASAELRDVNGEVVGTATFVEEAGGVRITVEVSNLPPGEHGLHIHTVGQCSPDFTAAGGHFNPLDREHGLDNPNGPHAGDLPILEVAEDGTGSQEIVNDIITLSAGPTSLFDEDGSAVIVHADPDDNVTDPTGNAGDRIACGPVEAAAP